MKYLASLILLTILSSCSTPETMEECVQNVKKEIKFYQINPKNKEERINKTYLEIGIMLKCKEYNGDSNKVLNDKEMKESD